MQRIASLLAFVILSSFFGCASANDPNTQLKERTNLFEEKAAIQDLVFNTTCTGDDACEYIAFGSKPCGGPWFYLVYNNAIETEIKTRVAAYNKKEKAFNEKYGISSDCAMVAPPSQIKCENGHCIPIYK